VKGSVSWVGSVEFQPLLHRNKSPYLGLRNRPYKTLASDRQQAKLWLVHLSTAKIETMFLRNFGWLSQKCTGATSLNENCEELRSKHDRCFQAYRRILKLQVIYTHFITIKITRTYFNEPLTIRTGLYCLHPVVYYYIVLSYNHQHNKFIKKLLCWRLYNNTNQNTFNYWTALNQIKQKLMWLD
jgi:hypothetical protein